jgi:light-harvesting protein B-800-850 beta chain
MQKVTLLYLLAFSWLYAYQSVQGRGGEHWSLTATLHVKEQVRWLTLKEAEEVHSYLIDGTRVFGVIALIAHLLVAVSTPWLG